MALTWGREEGEEEGGGGGRGGRGRGRGRRRGTQGGGGRGRGGGGEGGRVGRRSDRGKGGLVLEGQEPPALHVVHCQQEDNTCI